MTDSPTIRRIWIPTEDAFSNFDIFKAIESYELLLHAHSPHDLKRSIMEVKIVFSSCVGTLLAQKYPQHAMKRPILRPATFNLFSEDKPEPMIALKFVFVSLWLVVNESLKGRPELGHGCLFSVLHIET